jgi:hypothetical protein
MIFIICRCANWRSRARARTRQSLTLPTARPCHFVRKFMHEIVVIGHIMYQHFLLSPFRLQTRMSNLNNNDDFLSFTANSAQQTLARQPSLDKTREHRKRTNGLKAKAKSRKCDTKLRANRLDGKLLCGFSYFMIRSLCFEFFYCKTFWRRAIMKKIAAIVSK